MGIDFDKTLNIVNTGLLPKKVSLSNEAQSRLDDVVTIEEARRLLGQTGQGHLVNIPLMLALLNEGFLSDYKIDYKKLFQIFLSNRDSISEKVRKSYDEVVGMANVSEVGNVQGIKLFTEYKKKLIQSIDSLHEDVSYLNLHNTVSLYVKFLQIAYILIGRQH